jgi:phosphoribosyl 1,2-cyclic phosphate phosphodiesterase
MKLTFLGTGTSQGVPMIGCDCRVCRSADPRDTRTRSSVFVRDGETTVLIDTTPELRVQSLRENLMRIDAVVYTHAHSDHAMGFDDLRRFCDINGGTIPVYASAPTFERLEKAFDYAFDAANTIPGYVHPVPHVIDGPFTLGPIEFVPLPVPHGRTVTLGFLFRKEGRSLGAYISDCAAVPDDIRALLMDIPVLILDGLREHPHPTHLCIPEAIAVGQAVRAGATYLTHLTHNILHAERSQTLPKGVFLAYDGLTLEL